MGGFLKEGADVVARVSVAYEQASSDQAWAETLADAMTPVMNASRGVGVHVIEHAPDLSSARYAASAIPAGEDWPWARAPDAGLETLGLEAFRAAYFPSQPVSIFHEIESRFSPKGAARVKRARASLGVPDSLGVVTHPAPGVVVTLYALHDSDIQASQVERTVLERAALHIEAAFRLRRFPAALVCELDADGRLTSGSSPVARAEVLSQSARALADAHAASGRASDALALWPALIDGRLTVIRRGAGARTRYLFVENPPAARATRSLTSEEVQTLTLAARGFPNKLVAYGLGISPAAASRRLARSAEKLGLMTRAELIRVASILTREPRASSPDTVLSAAEREVLALIQNGLSDSEIARMRSRSIRTVANQVASLLEKTGCASRRGLTALPSTGSMGEQA